MKTNDTIHTRRQILSLLPEPYDRQAIDNSDKGFLEGPGEKDLASLLLCSFDWTKSKEGFHYWNNLYNQITSLEYEHNNPPSL